ncbi:aminotransferase class I/II-fold pyridoxal phosphate-dependent enzyme [Staphylospora marina]|uniref:aminotransferase class I/II-fold pyridoxal phosphate-dependent enzyme n=1 Tax=Staphylospora marina TaxID=2490858 RepID=UPI000F5B9EB7|nr:aminotransferase class I/II-fold pyridoxal phosphate-dependent enzyme [Staphylospora marina]
MRVSLSQKLRNLDVSVFVELFDAKNLVAEKGMSIIDLSVGSPDLPPPPVVMQTIQKWAADQTKYGYTITALPEFKQAVASFYENRYGVSLNPEREVLQLMGSQDGLAHLAMTLIDPGDVVLVPDPGYPIFETGVRLAGGTPYKMPLLEENGFLPRLEEIPSEVLAKAKLMILNYPGNPVTAMAGREFFEEVVRFAKKHELIVAHDFTYSELVYDGRKAVSFLSVPGAKEVGVEFNSLSKTFNMAGCRIGYVTGYEDVLAGLALYMSHTHYGIFYPVQKAAEAVLRMPEETIRSQRLVYESRRDVLVSRLKEMGWEVSVPPATMYVWTRIPEGWTSEAFVFRLLEETGVVLTPGRAFGERGEGFVRISMVQPSEMLLEAAMRIGRFLSANRQLKGSVR